MKNIMKATLLAAALWGCSKPNEIITCGDATALVIDLDKSEGSDIAVTWRWDVAEVKGILPDEYQRLMVPLDECKFVNGGKEILLCSSGGGALLLDRKTKKPLFWAKVPMAHSAELLPGRRIAVALSTHARGNSLELYDVAQSEKVLWRDEMYSGHGVVWMKERKSAFTLNYDELREYILKDWKSDNASMELVNTWKIPGKGGHDLSRVSKDKLLVTEHSGTWVFDIPSGSFSEFEPLKDVNNVKSLNYNEKTKSLIYTKAEISWWTHHIYSTNPEKVLTIDDIDLYKVRTIQP